MQKFHGDRSFSEKKMYLTIFILALKIRFIYLRGIVMYRN